MEAANVSLQAELDEAIENWRRVWKSGDIERVLQLYSEDVRVMRGGRNIVVGREQLRPTLLEFQDIGLADIQFHSDEVGGIAAAGGEGTLLAYQRYHEPLVREDGSEIATVYGLMIWKNVGGSWLIDVYANCPVPSVPTNTVQLKASIQHSFDLLGEAMASHDIEEALKYFTDDCHFMPPGEQFKGKAAVRQYLDRSFKQGHGRLEIDVESVVPMFEVYVISHLVHVTYPSFRVLGRGGGQVVLSGCGNAVIRRSTSSSSSSSSRWEITQAVWNAIPRQV